MSTEVTQALIKALEAGGYDAAPSTLVQGSALQIEDLSSVMHTVTFDDKRIKLSKFLAVEPCKATLAQWDRELSYGGLGYSAVFEGAVGQEEDSQFARIVVPMSFYSHIRRVTVQSNLVATVDGQKAEDRAASAGAKKVAADVELDIFRGKADFSNAGLFDGNMLAIANIPNMLGLDAQIRMSDGLRNARDLMLGELGGDDSVVVAGGGPLTQSMIEDAAAKSAMNYGSADHLFLDIKVMATYNKISQGKERIVLAGSAQDSTGADLRRQWTSNGDVKIDSSRFLAGKTAPAQLRSGAPAAPSIALAAAGASTSLGAGTYFYFATACNELGESGASAAVSVAASAGDQVTVTITPSGSPKYFNVYRSLAGGSAASAKFIGRVVAAVSGTTAFLDLNNKIPGFTTGFLVEKDTMAIKELAPYSRMKLAVTALNMPEAHFRFCTLAVYKPRSNCLIDNLSA